MKIPLGLVDLYGRQLKGSISISPIQAPNTELKEFGTEINDNDISCYVLTAPEDVIQIQFVLNSGAADFVDLIVDGVRRNSMANGKRSIFQGAFTRSCLMARGTAKLRGGFKHCLMQVKDRGWDSAAVLQNGPVASTVGSIMLQLFQRDASPGESTDSGAPINLPSDAVGEAARYPDFEDCASWEDTPNNNGIRNGVPTTPFEIGLIEQKKGLKVMKDKVKRTYSSEHKLIATFIFHLCSAEMLRMSNFENIPDYVALPYTPAADNTPGKRGRPSKKAITPDIKNDESDLDNESDEDLDTLFIPDSKDLQDNPERSQRVMGQGNQGINNNWGDEIAEHRTAPSVDRFLAATQRPLAIQGMPEAPAYLASLKRDLGPEDSDESSEDLSGSDVDLPTKSVLSEIKRPPTLQVITPPGSALKPTNTFPKSFNRMAQETREIIEIQASDSDSDDDSLDLDFARTNRSKASIGMPQELQQTDFRGPRDPAAWLSSNPALKFAFQQAVAERNVARHVSEPLKLDAPLKVGHKTHDRHGSNINHPIRKVSEIADDISQLTDVAPMEEVLISVGSSMRHQSISTVINPSQISTQSHDTNHPVSSEPLALEKRKFASISDAKLDMMESRKSTVLPATRNTAAVEQRVLSAQARVDAAERRRKQLEEEYRAAMSARENIEKARRMIQAAEEMERENAELQAKIAAIYGESFE